MKFNKQRLAELQAAGLPHMQATDWATIKEDCETARAMMAKLDAYLSAFVRMEDGKCICCGAQQGAKDIGDVILGNAQFTWGLAHGEGFCADCGYPARAHHYLKDPEFTARNVILQYHPDELSFEEREEQEVGAHGEPVNNK